MRRSRGRLSSLHSERSASTRRAVSPSAANRAIRPQAVSRQHPITAGRHRRADSSACRAVAHRARLVDACAGLSDRFRVVGAVGDEPDDPRRPGLRAHAEHPQAAGGAPAGAPVCPFQGEARRHPARDGGGPGGPRADRGQRVDSHERGSLVQPAYGRDADVGQCDRRRLLRSAAGTRIGAGPTARARARSAESGARTRPRFASWLRRTCSRNASISSKSIASPSARTDGRR